MSPPSSPESGVQIIASVNPRPTPENAANGSLNRPTSEFIQTSGRSRKHSGRKRVRREMKQAYRKIDKLEKQLAYYKKRCSKYKTRYYRELKSDKKKDTPRKAVRKLTGGIRVGEAVKKKLLFNEVLVAQLKSNFAQIRQNKASRRNFASLVAGKITKKYRVMKYLKNAFNFTVFTKSNDLSISKYVKQSQLKKIREDIQRFLQNDLHSTVCPGKKDTITRKGCKKQKRFLNDSLLNLHKTYCKEHIILLVIQLFVK